MFKYFYMAISTDCKRTSQNYRFLKLVTNKIPIRCVRYLLSNAYNSLQLEASSTRTTHYVILFMDASTMLDTTRLIG